MVSFLELSSLVLSFSGMSYFSLSSFRYFFIYVRLSFFIEVMYSVRYLFISLVLYVSRYVCL